MKFVSILIDDISLGYSRGAIIERCVGRIVNSFDHMLLFRHSK